MKKKLLLLLSVITVTGALTAQNPIIRDQFTADPTARVFDGRVYVYPSHDIQSPIERLKEWFCMADYHVFSSENLVDWTDHGVIISQKNVPWVAPDSYSMWAPDCVYKNGNYYFYFPSTPNDTIRKGFNIGVAIADKPHGPYAPQAEPIKGVNGIDPCVFIDKDNQAYIYWSGRGMFMAKLKDNMLELATEPVQITGLPDGFKEGPFLFERKGKYYYTFPWVQDKTETLAYAMGNSPMGPFEFKGLIMDQWPLKCWTNHHSIVEFKDQWYLFYHHNDFSPEFDKNRSARIDSLFFQPDGTIQKVTPTLRGVGITDAQTMINPDRYSKLSSQGASIDFLDKENKFSGWKTILAGSNAWVQYNRVDFGKSTPKSIRARVSSTTGGAFQVRLNGPDGTVISTFQVPKGGRWAVGVSPVNNIPTGVQDLCITTLSSQSIEIDWISFE